MFIVLLWLKPGIEFPLIETASPAICRRLMTAVTATTISIMITVAPPTMILRAMVQFFMTGMD
jgi:hypothetical protein